MVAGNGSEKNGILLAMVSGCDFLRCILNELDVLASPR